MFSHLSDHKKGLLLTTFGGLALSMDIPLIRLSSGEVWSVLSARSLATIVVALAVLVVIRRVTGSLQSVLPGWLQPIALATPASHIFEGMRMVIGQHAFPTSQVLAALGLNAIYMSAAVLFFYKTFALVREKGLLAKTGE